MARSQYIYIAERRATETQPAMQALFTVKYEAIAYAERMLWDTVYRATNADPTLKDCFPIVWYRAEAEA